MKVYFSYGLYQGCNYVRAWLPMKYNNWMGDYTDIETRRSPQEVVGLMLQSDIVVMQRPFEDQRKIIFNLLRQVGKKIVFDNDDTYKQLPRDLNNQYREVIDEQLGWFIRRADLVTTSTEFLKSEYENLNKNVVVLPNCIDPDDWPEPQEYQNGKLRVGLVGSVGYDDWKVCKNDLERLSKEKDIRLVIMFGLSKRDWKLFEGLNAEYHYFVPMKDYFQKLKSLKLDLMIIPRQDNYFNRCKSNIKFLEASMLEIPVLAQGFKDGTSPYQQNKNDQNYLTIVYDNWYEAIMEAKKNIEILKKKAREARKYVLENYNIKSKFELWKKIYQNLI